MYTEPPKADGKLLNKADLLGNIAVVERGGRVHFPDIVRRLLAVGVTGIVFIERTDNKHVEQSLFDGFHSSGRQPVSIPIVLLSKYHADQLLEDKPTRISIELLWREQACKHVVPDDVYFGIQTAARVGDVELLRHLLEIDTTGNVIDNFPKAVALCDAAENGHVDCIEILHSIGVSLDEQKPTGVSPLMMACSVGNVEAARALLMFGASLDLEDFGLMPCLLACYGSHPSSSTLHRELTDVIRFVLMDPDQKRLPSSPLLNSLFIEEANILNFVIRAYDEHVQYKGHMTTIANTIFTLTNTPNCRSSSVAITCQDVVRQYTTQHQKWMEFEQIFAEQNRVEMLPLGERNAPLCHGCLKLKQSAVEYVSATLTHADGDDYAGYLETIFSGAASHHCKVTYTAEFITGFMYMKDKIHDHIPIPQPTRLWFCDTLQSANWANRMKWVIPTSVRKWYSFGVTEGPGSGAHGLQFSSKGYKNFIVLTDTWGRQEQWMPAIEDSVSSGHLSLATQMSRGNTESAMAIEIDNEVDAEEIDVMWMREVTSGSGAISLAGSSMAKSVPKNDSNGRTSRLSEEEEGGNRRRSLSSIESETEPLLVQAKNRCRTSAKMRVKTRMTVLTINLWKTSVRVSW